MADRINGAREFTPAALVKIFLTLSAGLGAGLTIGAVVYSAVAEPPLVRASEAAVQEKLDRQWQRHQEDMDDIEGLIDLRFNGLREYLDERFNKLEKR